jgi:hypothetical protein
MWTEVELPPLKIAKLDKPEPAYSNKATIDLYAVKFILEDAEGNRRIKFHDNEMLFIDYTYKLELLPK